MSWYMLTITSWAVAILLMAMLWVWQKKTRQSSIVDVAWCFCVGLLGATHCFFAEGLPARRVIVACMILFWATRLELHIWNRVRSMPEDGRYVEMHENWGDQVQKKLFIFYQFQAFGAALFALPMLVAGFNSAPLGVFDALGVIVFLTSIIGESLADNQLQKFRTDPSNKGKVCKRGLWRYSRHPNYFFEWLHWWAYLLIAIGNPWWPINFIFPLAMLYFILFTTGIPPTERQALKSRGQAYRDYQKTTSAFFPWFPKSECDIADQGEGPIVENS